MSGDEADESSVGDTSSEEEDVPLPVSPFKSGTDEPFKVVFKGGSPWGFDLKGGTESKAPLQVSQVTESCDLSLFCVLGHCTVNIRNVNTPFTFFCKKNTDLSKKVIVFFV